jgi:hypothetical protein
MKGEGFATALAVALCAAVGSAQEATQRVDIVRVIGCLRHTVPDVWILSAATDPVTVSRGSEPVQPPPSTTGTNEFKLIGTEEFALPSRKDHLVSVKGLLIKATPMSRLNITSMTTLADSCVAAKK